MPTIEVNSKDLLDAVKQLPPAEFEAFIAEALALRQPATDARLSPAETRLIQRINRGLPAPLGKRYAQLIARRQARTLTADEHQELLDLTHEAESRDAERAAALLELAALRRMPVRTLMKQMGIQAPPVHG